MSVLALGLSRTGTESLRAGLLHLGYQDCYHGYSTINAGGWRDSRGWHKLLTRKLMSSASSKPLQITAEEFDEILGDCMAVTDIPAVMFASELLDAYPEAKVIVNRRTSVQEWKASFRSTTYAAEQSWVMWLCSFFNAELFWMERIFIMIIQDLVGKDFEMNAESAYLRHYEQLEGKLREKNREYLNWHVQEGWKPICEFLGRDVPKVKFPRKNQRDDHDRTIESLMKKRVAAALGRISVAVGCILAIMLALWLRHR